MKVKLHSTKNENELTAAPSLVPAAALATGVSPSTGAAGSENSNMTKEIPMMFAYPNSQTHPEMKSLESRLADAHGAELPQC